MGYKRYPFAFFPAVSILRRADLSLIQQSPNATGDLLGNYS